MQSIGLASLDLIARSALVKAICSAWLVQFLFAWLANVVGVLFQVKGDGRRRGEGGEGGRGGRGWRGGMEWKEAVRGGRERWMGGRMARRVPQRQNSKMWLGVVFIQCMRDGASGLLLEPMRCGVTRQSGEGGGRLPPPAPVVNPSSPLMISPFLLVLTHIRMCKVEGQSSHAPRYGASLPHATQGPSQRPPPPTGSCYYWM